MSLFGLSEVNYPKSDPELTRPTDLDNKQFDGINPDEATVEIDFGVR